MVVNGQVDKSMVEDIAANKRGTKAAISIVVPAASREAVCVDSRPWTVFGRCSRGKWGVSGE